MAFGINIVRAAGFLAVVGVASSLCPAQDKDERTGSVGPSQARDAEPSMLVPVPDGVDPEDELDPTHVFTDTKSPEDLGLTAAEVRIARGWLRKNGFRAAPDEGESGDGPPSAMPTLTRIDNTEDVPYCMHVRIVGPSWGCSGALIGPRHVITAAHCVSAGNGSPDWAAGAVVTPGYDDGFAPYGTATVVDAMLWSDWEDRGDWDHDIAILELDRPIGALTGWFGYGTNNSASFYRNTTFYKRSYPGAAPYDFSDMYSRSGSFDSTDVFGCDTCWGSGRELRVDSRGYDGESGSAAYAVIGGDRIVYAVHSNGNDSTWFDCVRFDNNRFDDIGAFIQSGTPSSADLVPLRFTTSSGSIRAGTTVSYSFTVINNSRVSRSASMSWGVHLSTNSTITSSDRKLTGVASVSSSSISANGVVTKSGTVTIPSDVAAGTWNLGILITTSDANSSNNATSGQDAQQVLITN